MKPIYFIKSLAHRAWKAALPLRGKMFGRKRFFCDESGLTTVGMTLAILLSLALILGSTQVYRINALAGEVQNVADAAALAAENDVAEFMIVVRLCDAAVLSMSLCGLAVSALAVAAACVPFAHAFADALLQTAGKIFDARDSFSEKAASALNRLQAALPFLAAVSAASVAGANNGSSSNYLALALLSPQSASDIEAPMPASDAFDSVKDSSDDIKSASEEAQKAAEEALSYKQEAYEHDCGAYPAYCMYERAHTLASMSGSDNSYFASIDTWSFSAALTRVQTYYRYRLNGESPENSTVEEQVKSALRTRFYAYATAELAKAYVHESEDSFDAYFPLLPKNTSEMRESDLYTEEVYPYNYTEEGQLCVHAWAGCGNAASAMGLTSISYMEAQAGVTCTECGFTAASLGKVAAASSSIENGFEYHYRAFAEAARSYEKARSELDSVSSELKEKVQSLFDGIGKALSEAFNKRIEAVPPGSSGAISVVVNLSQVSPSVGFMGSFVSQEGSLGARAALSSATLLEDESEEGDSVISSLLDSFNQDSGAAIGAAGIVLDIWSALLNGWNKGQAGLLGAVEKGLNSLPLVGASGLGTWAASALSATLEGLGFAPAQVNALRPVLVNAGHVAAADSQSFSAKLVSLKKQAIANPLKENDLFASLLGASEEAALNEFSALSSSITLAEVDLFGTGETIDITLSLPTFVEEAGASLISGLFASIRSLYASVSGQKVWV